MALDAKLRASIVEGISVFLSLFDQPQVAGVFCPPPPAVDESASIDTSIGDPGEDAAAVRPVPGLRRRLPPLAELIADGKVLALNMPAGANPALARAIGVLLKERLDAGASPAPRRARAPARTVPPARRVHLRRVPGVRHRRPGRSLGRREGVRADPAVPLHPDRCDTINLLSPSVLPGGEAWRTLVQTLRTRIFLSLSDESSARIGSEMCGSVMKTQPSYTFTETTGRPEFSLIAPGARGADAARSARASRSARPGSPCSRPVSSHSSPTTRRSACPTTASSRCRPRAPT